MDWITNRKGEMLTARLAGRGVVRKHHTKQNADFVRKWRKVLDTRRRVAHRQIMEQGKPKHTLSKVRTAEGRTSAKAADIKAATTAHFTKVQTATISDTPEAVRDYPWEKGPNPMKMRKANSTATMMEGYTREVYNEHLRRLPNNKAAGPDGVPNEILKIMPEAFHDAMHALLIHVGGSGKTPTSWKTSNTILLYKKGDPLTVKNYRPVAL